ncbi:dentin sialophosphoprotein-like [Mytilus trossulus]|uniref:dentin sialophosphoprotein-like n=1 Tax=Mytilus trossulus TaxID=6551 RepID=UPI0030073CB4
MQPSSKCRGLGGRVVYVVTTVITSQSTLRFNKSNKLIEINDSNMIVCYPTSSKSRQGNYDSVLDGDSPVETSKSNGCDHDEIEIEINKESMFNQKKGDENINTLSIQMEGYVYASVGSPKNKQTAENKKSANQQEDDLYDESKEGIYDTSGNRRHKEIHTAGNYYSTDHLKKEDSKSGLDMDLIDPQKAGGRKPSTNVTNNTLGNAGYEDVDLDNTGMKFKPQNNEETIDKVNQQNDEHFKKQKEDTDKGEDNSTTPFESAVYSLVSKLKNKQTTENKSPDDQQEDNLYEESKKGIDETSGDKENHAADHDTTDTSEHIEKQQTIGDLESSIKSNQTGSYINPVLELEEVGPCSPPLRSFGGIHDGRQINRNSEQQ